jgi:hypothetical protein
MVEGMDLRRLIRQRNYSGAQAKSATIHSRSWPEYDIHSATTQALNAADRVFRKENVHTVQTE